MSVDSSTLAQCEQTHKMDHADNSQSRSYRYIWKICKFPDEIVARFWNDNIYTYHHFRTRSAQANRRLVSHWDTVSIGICTYSGCDACRAHCDIVDMRNLGDTSAVAFYTVLFCN